MNLSRTFQAIIHLKWFSFSCNDDGKIAYAKKNQKVREVYTVYTKPYWRQAKIGQYGNTFDNQ